ncbi:conserved hypothetical protein [uncultured Thiomicrorhabdus sp.]
MIKFWSQIHQDTRKWIARVLILLGIFIAYSPYWIDEVVEKAALDKFLDVSLFFGWWLLGLGLVIYFLNMWLDIKLEKQETDESH